MKKYDKSLIEVWGWKEQVYQEFKGLTVQDYLKKVRRDAEKILSDNNLKLAPVSFKKELQKVA